MFGRSHPRDSDGQGMFFAFHKAGIYITDNGHWSGRISVEVGLRVSRCYLISMSPLDVNGKLVLTRRFEKRARRSEHCPRDHQKPVPKQ